jgi:HPt (histidine-containing phosphotransfer) domain-containing protein
MVVLEELRALGEEDLRDLVEMYFADLATQLEVLREALETDDSETVAAAAHRIKGASLSIGATLVASFASEIEQAGKSGELERCEELLESLDTELEPTRDALSAELFVNSAAEPDAPSNGHP